jgi:hypothetical protein
MRRPERMVIRPHRRWFVIAGRGSQPRATAGEHRVSHISAEAPMERISRDWQLLDQ